MLQMFKAVQFWDDRVEAILNHADKRSQFDWKAAVQALDGFTQTDSQIQQWHDSANHKSTSARLLDVVDCTDLALRRSHWRDFIVLVETFVENAGRVLAEEVLGHYLFEKEYLMLNQIDPNLSNHLRKMFKLKGSSCIIEKAICREIVQYESQLDTTNPFRQVLGNQRNQEKRMRNSAAIEKIDKPVNDLRNKVVHEMANLSKADLEKEAQKHLKDRDSLTALIKEMRNLLIELGEPTKKQRFLYDGINDFVLEALQPKAG